LSEPLQRPKNWEVVLKEDGFRLFAHRHPEIISMVARDGPGGRSVLVESGGFRQFPAPQRLSWLRGAASSGGSVEPSMGAFVQHFVILVDPPPNGVVRED
jgi:hypothetical protein